MKLIGTNYDKKEMIGTFRSVNFVDSDFYVYEIIRDCKNGLLITTTEVSVSYYNARYRKLDKNKKGYFFAFGREKIYLENVKWNEGINYKSMIEI